MADQQINAIVESYPSPGGWGILGKRSSKSGALVVKVLRCDLEFVAQLVLVNVDGVQPVAEVVWLYPVVWNDAVGVEHVQGGHVSEDVLKADLSEEAFVLGEGRTVQQAFFVRDFNVAR